MGHPVTYKLGLDYGCFRMFIDSKKKFKDDLTEIKGRIKDKFGRADFEGTISPNYVRFIKKYQEEHSDIDAIRDNIIYEGSLSDQINNGKTGCTGIIRCIDSCSAIKRINPSTAR